MEGAVVCSGEVKTKLIRGHAREKRVYHPLQDIKVFFQLCRIKLGAKISGQRVLYGRLSIRKFNSLTGWWENHGVVGYKVVTDNGVAFLVDDWDDDSTDITTMNYHDSGTGTNGENASDSGLQTACGESRDAGSKTQPSANVLQTVATHTYAGTFAITEHGIFSASTAGVLWDRTVFSAINVVASDSIQFTYQCTLTSGS